MSISACLPLPGLIFIGTILLSAYIYHFQWQITVSIKFSCPFIIYIPLKVEIIGELGMGGL